MPHEEETHTEEQEAPTQEADNSTASQERTHTLTDSALKTRLARQDTSSRKAVLEELGVKNLDEAKSALQAFRDQQEANKTAIEKAEEIKRQAEATQAELAQARAELQAFKLETHVAQSLASAGVPQDRLQDATRLFLADLGAGGLNDAGDVDTAVIEASVKQLKATKTWLFEAPTVGYKGITPTSSESTNQTDRDQEALNSMKQFIRGNRR